MPIDEPSAESFTAPKPVMASTRRVAAKPASPRPGRRVKTEAKFVAPENAIAVDASQPILGGTTTEEKIDPASTIVTAAVQETVPPVVEAANPVTVAAAPTIAEPIPAKVAMAVEKPAPQPTELPAQIAIAYRMSSSISDGVADYSWTRNGKQFEIDSSMRATGFLVGNLVGVLHQVSSGTITPAGLRPSSYQIRRGEAASDSAEFLYATNELKLTRGSNPARTVPLAPQLQDMQSFLFQLAYDAPGLKSTEDRLDVMVTNARKVYRHRFRQIGIETVQTRSGPIQTVHLRSEAADPEDVYEVWLAPGNYHLPVKMKFFAGRFPVELIATSIRTTP